MADFPDFTVQDLSNLSGRPVEDYDNSALVVSALIQAELLFKIGTCLGDEWPEDPTMSSLAQMGLLAMADAIYLTQQHQKVLANPFSSETIGSYSYSKVAGAVMTGLPTGVTWFDLAVSKLSICSIVANIPIGGGIEVFENDAVFTTGSGGNVRMLSPKDMNRSRTYGFDPAGNDYGIPQSLPGGGIYLDDEIDGGSP